MASLSKRIRCFIFGHELVTEVYARRDSATHYSIIEEIVCARCERTTQRTVLAYGLTRKDLLHQEWFIQK